MHTNEHPQDQLLETCVEHILEIIPMVRGNINAHIQSEVNRYELITPGQARVLYHVSQGTSNITALTVRQKTSAPTISRQVDCLVERGLIFRVRQAGDRRVVVLGLTAKGEEVLNGIMNSTRVWMGEKIRQSLESSDTVQLESAIQALEWLREVFKPEQKPIPLNMEETINRE